MKLLALSLGVLVGFWLLSLLWFAIQWWTFSREQRPERLRVLETARGWAFVIAWGPIAFLGMGRRRSPHEEAPERWRD